MINIITQDMVYNAPLHELLQLLLEREDLGIVRKLVERDLEALAAPLALGDHLQHIERGTSRG